MDTILSVVHTVLAVEQRTFLDGVQSAQPPLVVFDVFLVAFKIV
jgi:hypothetical protein